MANGDGFRPYVSVAKRRQRTATKIAKLKKSGRVISPVEISGRKIARTFWGASWCENLEAYSDYDNRLPRGRTYVRNGSVVDLQIEDRHLRGRCTASHASCGEKRHREVGPPGREEARPTAPPAADVDRATIDAVSSRLFAP